jgi:ribokinase
MTVQLALFVGDVGIDLTVVVPKAPAADEKVFATEVREDVGGVVANASVACVHAGSSARMVVGIGNDPMGQTAIDLLQRRGVDVIAKSTPGRTCQALIAVDPGGEKRLIVVPGVSMYPGSAMIQGVDLEGVGWVHTAAYCMDSVAALTDRCRADGIPWSVDLEPATIPSNPMRCRAWVAGADTVFVNARAAEMLGSDPVELLTTLGAHRVILTKGASGVEYRDSAGQHITVRPPDFFGPAVDTTGAGDALAGWYVARRTAGDGPREALDEAVVAASLSCLAVGAQRSYPARNTVLRHLANAVHNSALNPERKAPL